MIKAILFDADNTIYYTRKVSKKGYMAGMKFFSKQTHKSASQLYKEWMKIVDKIKNSKDPKKRHIKYSYSKLAKKFGLKNVNKAYEITMKTMLKHLKIDPSFKKSLKKIKKSKKLKIKTAVVTEEFRKPTMQKLKKFRLTKSFDAIITNENVKTMKPDKAYYKSAFKRLKVKPKQCIVVGDSFEKDLKIAKQLGCTTVLFKKKDKKADYSIHNFNQLVKIVKEKNKIT